MSTPAATYPPLLWWGCTPPKIAPVVGVGVHQFFLFLQHTGKTLPFSPQWAPFFVVVFLQPDEVIVVRAIYIFTPGCPKYKIKFERFRHIAGGGGGTKSTSCPEPPPKGVPKVLVVQSPPPP